MNTKRDNFFRALRTSSGSVHAAGAVFWLVILISSLVRQLAQHRADDTAHADSARGTHGDVQQGSVTVDEMQSDDAWEVR